MGMEIWMFDSWYF